MVLVAVVGIFAAGLATAPGAFASATNCETIPAPGVETYEGLHVVRGSGNIEGTNGDDFIIGSSGNDTAAPPPRT